MTRKPLLPKSRMYSKKSFIYSSLYCGWVGSHIGSKADQKNGRRSVVKPHALSRSMYVSNRVQSLCDLKGRFGGNLAEGPKQTPRNSKYRPSLLERSQWSSRMIS